jgi:hypothetical protein
MPEPDADWEMTRPLSAREMASIVGELFGKVGAFAALALVLMLAADDVLRLFPQIQGTLRWPIVYGVGYCGSYLLLYFLKRRGHA